MRCLRKFNHPIINGVGGWTNVAQQCVCVSNFILSGIKKNNAYKSINYLSIFILRTLLNLEQQRKNTRIARKLIKSMLG